MAWNLLIRRTVPLPDRLSALDAAFVALESDEVSFAVGSILVFDRPLELARLRAYVDAALDGLPRYRQRIARTPILGHPVWLDDAAFAVDRHVDAVGPPAPVAPGELEALAARLLTAALPTDHPPWRLWLLDLTDGGSAIIAVVHHALVDGIAGVRLLEHLLRGVPDDGLPARRPRVVHAAPRPRDLLAAEVRHRVDGLRHLRARVPARPRQVARTLVELVSQGLHPASDVGLNPHHTGLDRVLASFRVELAAVTRIKRSLHATLNDVVLATTAGAMRRWLARAGGAPSSPGDVRAMIPASTSPAGDQALSGNRVALLLAPLPVAEPDPARRLAQVAAATRALKDLDQAAAGELLVGLSDVTSPALLSGVLRLAMWRRAFNVIITNVPGPPFSLYLLGARLERIVPIVNLWPHCALGLAVMSYGGRLEWSVHADRAVIPDLAPFVADLERSFDELGEAAAAAAPPTATATQPGAAGHGP